MILTFLRGDFSVFSGVLALRGDRSTLFLLLLLRMKPGFFIYRSIMLPLEALNSSSFLLRSTYLYIFIVSEAIDCDEGVSL